MRTFLRAVLVAALLAPLSPVRARATVHSEPVKLRVAGPVPVFRPGEPATVRFELAARQDVTVSGLSVESASLARPFARRALPSRVTADAPAGFEVELLPGTNPEPLVVRWEVDGVPYERTIDLASRTEEAIAARARMVQVSDAQPKPPSARMLAEADSVRRAGQAAGAGGTLIFFSGRLVYTNPGNGGSVPAMDVGAMGVRVSLMDEDTGFDDELASTFTDYDGDFYYYAYWDGQLLEGDPELYIKFETDHPWVIVQEGFWDIEYSWNTSTRGSSTADVHIGTFRPADISTHPALHIATSIAKAHLWCQEYAGYFVDGVDVKWPDGNNAFYDPTWGQIHIGAPRQWEESVAVHEYGHYFVDEFADSESPSYCNGICDSPNCGHCLWCEEGTNEAFSEGWADWFSKLVTKDFAHWGGVASVFEYSWESITSCGATGTWTDPSKTEGNFAAILWDIMDDGPGADDTDPNGFGWRDRMALGFDEIFNTLVVEHPTNSRSFLSSIAYLYPQHRASIWEVAMNNRWDLDLFAPGAVSNLTSSTHPVSTSTPNLNVTLTWTPPATDDWSGIKGYSIVFAATPTAPDVLMEAGVTTVYTSPDLAPGTYYATVAAVDRSNRVGAYATAGPFVVQQPTPVDIAPYTAPGWARPLVARATGDATTSSVPNPPAQLPGNTASTYFNASGRNQGQSEHVGFIGIRTRLFVDAKSFYTSGYHHPDAPGATFSVINRPSTIRGGRHMVGTILDGFNEWWEANEVNNYWSHAWVWTPLALSIDTPVRRLVPPPNPIGSWSGVFDGSPTHYNCDGFRITPSGWWNACWVAADADSDDYDVRLHPQSNSPDTGFDTVLGWGSEAEGRLDAVLVNRNTMGSAALDVGVINDLDAGQDFVNQSTFVVKHVVSANFAFADTAAVAFPDSELVVLREVYVPAAGPVSVTVWADTSAGPVRAAWLDRTYTVGALSSPHWTWPAGKLTFDVTASSAGYHCVALYRDPRDGRGARACTLGVGPTPSDLAPVTLGGWHGPVVPRPTTDGTPLSVPAPDTLHGGVATTYLNIAWRNDSPGAMPAGTFEVEAQVDGAPVVFAWVPALAANEHATVTGIGSPPLDVRGGRHLLSATYDGPGAVVEKSEDNNGWGEQWVWSPLVLTPGNGITAPAPPDPTGGFDRFSGVGPLFYNSAGYRAVFGAGSGLWGGIGLIPEDSTDTDLRVHDPVPGTRDGLGLALGHSSWGPYDSDYLIVRHDGARAVDASVIGGDDAPAGAFDICSDGAAALATVPLTTTDQLMGTSAVVRVHPVLLPAGDVRIRLVHVTGSVDWGVSLHHDSTEVQGKSDALAAAWFEPAGAGEELLVHLEAPDTFAIVAWKRGAGDRGQFGVYRLQVEPVTLDAGPGATPALTHLAPARPTPFRDRTTLSFELAAPGEARLEVFDLRGARVRTLARGSLAAGRHTLEWRGDADGGARLAPGLYLVRLEAGGVRAQHKVVKVE